MDQLKRYVECYIPTEACNLRCHYCYIAQKRKFNSQLASFPKAPEEVGRALSMERLGGRCLLNFCAGGETLLGEDVLPVLKALLKEGHYLMVVTNGTLTKRFEEMAQFPAELLGRLMFKFSFHYLELKRRGMMGQYFDNIRRMQQAGCSFTVELTPSDELAPYIGQVKQACMEELGALCHVTIARDDRTKRIEVLTEKSWEDYKKIWGAFQSELFDFKTTIFYQKRKEFCYAGDWSVYVNLATGAMSQCYCGLELDNIYRDIGEPLQFEAIGNNCRMAHCYNGHAFLTLGDIPELRTLSYAQVRNRVGCKGAEWLQPGMKSFLSQKLSDGNREYPKKKKRAVNRSHHRKVLKLLFHKAAKKAWGGVRKR